MSVVFQLFPSSQYIIYFQGNVQNTTKTFEECGITNNDQIIVIPKEQLDNKSEFFWKKVSENTSQMK
jgi:hypothetical protein